MNIKKTSILIFILILSITFFQINDYWTRNRNLRNEFKTKALIITKIIEETYKNSIANLEAVEKYIYDQMVYELKKNKNSYLIKTDKSFDTEFEITSEGFTFSEKRNKDFFVITLKEGKNIYRVSKSKENFKIFLKEGGLKNYLDNLSSFPEIEYIVFQDNLGIIYASSNVTFLKSFFSDSLIMYSFFEKMDTSRIFNHREKEVFEIIKNIQDETLLLRVAFKMEELEKNLNGNLKNFLFKFVLIIFTFFLLIVAITIFEKNINLSKRLLEENLEKLKILSFIDEYIFIKIIEDNHFVSFDNRFENFFKFSPLSIPELKKIVDENKEVKNLQIFYKNYRFLLSSTITPDNKRVVIYLKDISEIEKLKEEKNRMEFQSKLGELTYRISHELKNPLNSISIIIQRLIKKDILNRDEKEMLIEALEEVNRMNKKIVEFTRFSKPYEYKKEKINIKKLLDEVIRSLQILIEEKKLNLSIKNERETFILGDFQMLYIAFRNIILNGLEASFPGQKIKIGMDYRDGNIIFEIIDHGVGIEKEELEKIFDLFYTTKENGSGIGLTSAKKIIEDHQGSISVESEKGKGTKFTIVLKEYGL